MGLLIGIVVFLITVFLGNAFYLLLGRGAISLVSQAAVFAFAFYLGWLVRRKYNIWRRDAENEINVTGTRG